MLGDTVDLDPELSHLSEPEESSLNGPLWNLDQEGCIPIFFFLWLESEGPGNICISGLMLLAAMATNGWFPQGPEPSAHGRWPACCLM